MIKRLDRSELEDSLSLVWNVFCEYEAVNYPESGKQAFWQAIHSKEYLNMLSAYGVFENEKLIGIIATRSEGRHLALFFVDGSFQHKGIGRSLWNTVIENSTAKEITVHSSLFAKNIYEKLGFVQNGDLCDEGGIKYIPMVYENKNPKAKE